MLWPMAGKDSEQLPDKDKSLLDGQYSSDGNQCNQRQSASGRVVTGSRTVSLAGEIHRVRVPRRLSIVSQQQRAGC